MNVALVRNKVIRTLRQTGYNPDLSVAGGDRFRPREGTANVYIEVGTAMNEVRVRFYVNGRIHQRMDVTSERHLDTDLKAIGDTAHRYAIGESGMPQ